MKERKTKNTNEKERTYYFDYSLVVIIVFLLAFGLVMLYSISAYTAVQDNLNDMYYFTRQLAFSVLGLICMYGVSKFHYHIYGALSKFGFWVAMIGMALVLTPLGIERNYARRWLYIPVIKQFQPSEITKLAIILFIPFLICKMGKYVTRRENLVQLMLYGVSATLGVFLFTDDLSTAIIVMGIVMGIMWIAIPQMKQLIIAMFTVLIAGYVYLLNLDVSQFDLEGGFRLERIIVWLAPETYAQDRGYQVLQGLYAIGSGGLFGKGLGNGTQKLTAIPEVQNDYIIAAIIEELGIFGIGILLLMFGILLYRLFFIASNAPDMYGSLVVSGIFIHIALQIIFNIAVVTALVPNTGVTLPFISYGGTAILFLLIELGIALSVSRRIEIK